ncbi:MAG: lipid-A-disaccharide synthase, partial [Devosiaceae bacterium]|nr:lipid-A-disaccharide synthase [Devosiaceae bacterium MH13]
TVEAVVERKPDLVVVIDSPDFCHRVAKRVRAADPSIPIMGWVSPSVWAWRPGRAAAMRSFIDHLLVLLPFEVGEHERLGGPPATYVGHPLAAQWRDIEAPHVQPEQAPLLVLPGSRSGEIKRHTALLGDCIARAQALLADRGEPMPPLVLPTIAKHRATVEALVADWPNKPEIIVNTDTKTRAFAAARGAIAASGTVTLELALAKVPMVVVYRLDWLAKQFRFLIKTWTIVLPNLILGRPAVREYVDEYARPELMARALAGLLMETPERQAQLESFDELAEVMAGPDGESAADRAAVQVCRLLSIPTA